MTVHTEAEQATIWYRCDDGSRFLSWLYALDYDARHHAGA